MTPQEIFDTVANHLLTQNRKSIHIDGHGDMCMYRGPDGTKCAVGCLIPDELYYAGMECLNVEALVVKFPTLTSMLDEHILLLSELQSIHDANQPEQWRFLLHNLALDFELDPAVLNAYPER